MIERDMPSILAIERATGGDWTRGRFRRELRHATEGQWDTVGMVAEDAQGNVRGFAVYRLQAAQLLVLDMAAGDPGARAVLLARLVEKAKYHRRPLVWSDGAPF
jgi:ribosomal protein S18 acetylase RimI-like enzyme